MINSQILILDSGISKRHIDNISCVNFDSSWQDYNGHGSQIADILRLMNYKTKISSIKVLDENKECSLEKLIESLYMCIDINAEVVLLALSVENELYNDELKYVIRKIVQKGKIVVASVFNGRDISIPAAFNGVIGVKIGNINPDGRFYDPLRQVQCILPIEQIICESLDGMYKPFFGNSLACTLFAGYISQLIENINVCDINILENTLQNKQYNELSFYNLFQISDNAKYKCIRKKEIKDILVFVSDAVNVLWVGNNIHKGIMDIGHLNLFMQNIIESGLVINRRGLLLTKYLKDVDTLVDYFFDQELGVCV